jgi:hypothetical protein
MGDLTGGLMAPGTSPISNIFTYPSAAANANPLSASRLPKQKVVVSLQNEHRDFGALRTYSILSKVSDQKVRRLRPDPAQYRHGTNILGLAERHNYPFRID